MMIIPAGISGGVSGNLVEIAMNGLKIGRSGNDMLSIEVHDNPELAKKIRNSIANNWMESEDYKLNKYARGFLQGYDEKEGWALVEFWVDDKKIDKVQAYVDYLNRL